MIHKFNPKNAKINLDGGMREINHLVGKLIDAMQDSLVSVGRGIDTETEDIIWDAFQTILSEQLGIMDYNNHM